MCAYIEARTRKPKETRFLITSLGTGVLTRRLPYEQVINWGLAQWARPLLNIVLDGISDSTHDHMEKAHRSTYTNLEHYFRFQADLAAEQEYIDNATPKNIRALKVRAADLIRESENELNSLCRVLTLPNN
jgi:hypothetical protein